MVRRPSWDELYRLVERLTADLEAERAENRRLRVIIAEQAARITLLEAEVARLSGQSGGTSSGRLDLSRPPRPPRKDGPRTHRHQAFVRRRSVPTERQMHALDTCPDCRCALRGGSVKRWREVIEIEAARATVTAHGLVERRCPQCGRRCVASLAACGLSVGAQRFGPRLTALITTLRDEDRVPIRVIQRHLKTVWDLHVSTGEIIRLLHVVATRGQAAVAHLRGQIRASPAVHADETSWREDGQSRTLWVTATTDACAFAIGRRTSAQIDTLLGADYAGILITDFYAAYHHFTVHQRCWAHLIRELRDLLVQFPADATLAIWVQHVRHLYKDALGAAHGSDTQRHAARRLLDARLGDLCLPVASAAVPQRRLAARLLAHLGEIFTFVVTPDLPATNNRAERDLRPIVIARKIFGGTRSSQASHDFVTRASPFATWRLRGLNPFHETLSLLIAPQP